jgi:hypothetical protein
MATAYHPGHLNQAVSEEGPKIVKDSSHPSHRLFSPFQTFVCVERYLAVVHPVVYLKFKPLKYRVECCDVDGAWVRFVLYASDS